MQRDTELLRQFVTWLESRDLRICNKSEHYWPTTVPNGLINTFLQHQSNIKAGK